MHNDQDLIGSSRAAALLGIDRATFNRWVSARRVVPAVEFPGKTGARLFHRADIDALIEREPKASA